MLLQHELLERHQPHGARLGLRARLRHAQGRLRHEVALLEVQQVRVGRVDVVDGLGDLGRGRGMGGGERGRVGGGGRGGRVGVGGVGDAPVAAVMFRRYRHARLLVL